MLVSAIGAAGVSWSVPILHRAWLTAYRTAGYRKTGGQDASSETIGRATADALLPQPAAGTRPDEGMYTESTKKYIRNILLQGRVLGTASGRSSTLAVGIADTPTLNVIAGNTTFIAAVVSAAIWLHLGIRAKNEGNGRRRRPGGRRPAPSGAA